MPDFLNRKPKILLVDDDKDMLKLLSIKLSREGYAIRISHNAANIGELIRLDKPDYIFLDIHMDGIHGGDLCRKLKAGEDTSDIIIFLFSGNHNISEIAAISGADGFFEKPLDIAEVSKKLKGHSKAA